MGNNMCDCIRKPLSEEGQDDLNSNNRKHDFERSRKNRLDDAPANNYLSEDNNNEYEQIDKIVRQTDPHKQTKNKEQKQTTKGKAYDGEKHTENTFLSEKQSRVALEDSMEGNRSQLFK